MFASVRFLFLFLLLLLFIGCRENLDDGVDSGEIVEEETVTRVTFETEDAVLIVGNFWSGGEHAILLLHMMPSTKESWDPLAEALYAENFSVLAIDLRGHGESTNGDTIHYQEFSDEEHQASLLDVDAAVSFLEAEGMTTIDIVGASIGANLALWYQSEHSAIEKTVLLSAGEEYRGIVAEEYAEALQGDQKLFLVEGSEDASAAGTATLLAGATDAETELVTYESSAHGTALFDEDPELINAIVQWLNSDTP